MHSVYGPWDGAGRFATTVDAAAEYIGSTDETCELYLAHYECIVLELCDGAQPAGSGTRAQHRERETWPALPDLPCFHFVVWVQKLGRWFSRPEKIRSPAPPSFILTYIRQTMGWWAQLGRLRSTFARRGVLWMIAERLEKAMRARQA